MNYLVRQRLIPLACASGAPRVSTFSTVILHIHQLPGSCAGCAFDPLQASKLHEPGRADASRRARNGAYAPVVISQKDRHSLMLAGGFRDRSEHEANVIAARRGRTRTPAGPMIERRLSATLSCDCKPTAATRPASADYSTLVCADLRVPPHRGAPPSRAPASPRVGPLPCARC